MRTNKKTILMLTAFFAMTILTFGFTKKDFVKTKAQAIFEKTITAKNNTIKTVNEISTPEQEILGTWVLENDPSTKIEFSADGVVRTYEDNVLQNTDSYIISNECDGTTSSDGTLFLKTIDGEDGTEYCDVINGININNSNVLSLMSDNGKIIIYIKQ